jgi:serine/threonine protein kinase
MSTDSHLARLRSEVFRRLAAGESTPQQAEREIAEIDQAARSTPSGLAESQFSGATQMPGAALPAPQRGDPVSHFELIEQLDSGGMGVVWKAKDLETERLVVAKFVLGHLRGIPSVLKMAKESFLAAHGLRHPALCALIDFVNDPRLGPCVLMDYVPGITLTRYRKSYVERHGEFPLQHACRILEPIAGALDEAHRHGVIHRDVKPDNIMVLLDKSGTLAGAKLIDLGVAATVQDAISQYSVAAPEIDVVGTPLYWAPEQCKGHHPTAQTDQYALAAVAYELLVGHPPFTTSNRMQLLACIKDEIPEPIDSCSAIVNAALLKGMSKERKARHENCVGLLEAMTTSEASPTQIELPTPCPQAVQTTAMPLAAVAQLTEIAPIQHKTDPRPKPSLPTSPESEMGRKVGEAVRTERFFLTLTELAQQQRALKWSSSSFRSAAQWLPPLLATGLVAFLLMLRISDATYDPPTTRKFMKSRSALSADQKSVFDEARADLGIYDYSYVNSDDIPMLGAESYSTWKSEPLWKLISKDFPNVRMTYSDHLETVNQQGSTPKAASARSMQVELEDANKRLASLRETRSAMAEECAKWAEPKLRAYLNRPFWLAGFAIAGVFGGLGWLIYYFSTVRVQRIARQQAIVDNTIASISRDQAAAIEAYGAPGFLSDPAMVRAICIELNRSTKLSETHYWRTGWGTAIVAFLLGATGLHKYLSRRYAAGGLHFLLGATFFGLILAIPLGMIEGIMLAGMSTQSFYERYVIGDREWF